jgi:hypothetical protein
MGEPALGFAVTQAKPMLLSYLVGSSMLPFTDLQWGNENPYRTKSRLMGLFWGHPAL